MASTTTGKSGMIKADQPRCFPLNVLVAVSSRQDGSVLDRTVNDRHASDIVTNRKNFCKEAGIAYENCVYQIISYEPTATFDAIKEVDTPNTDGVTADVLYTETSGVGLFLPIADCVPAVIYDAKRCSLAVAHLGRHASIAQTMTKTINYFTQKGSDAADLVIWMGPSVSKEDYVLEYFHHTSDDGWSDYAYDSREGIHLDLAGFNKNLAMLAGVEESNIFTSRVNTARSDNYFSHSQGDANGRFAVVATMFST